MPGTFHILPAHAAYSVEPTTHLDEERDFPQTIPAACGVTLTRYRDDYASILVVKPEWQKDWCHQCVRAFRWPVELAERWSNVHGINELPDPIKP